MELLDYYFQDDKIVAQTIDGDVIIPLGDFWDWVNKNERNVYFSSYFDQVKEDTVEVSGVFKYMEEYISNSRTKDLEKDITDYINEKVTHNRNTDIVSSEG